MTPTNSAKELTPATLDSSNSWLRESSKLLCINAGYPLFSRSGKYLEKHLGPQMNGTFLHQALLGTLNSARRLIGSGSVRRTTWTLDFISVVTVHRVRSCRVALEQRSGQNLLPSRGCIALASANDTDFLDEKTPLNILLHCGASTK